MQHDEPGQGRTLVTSDAPWWPVAKGSLSVCYTSGDARATCTCLKSNGLKVIGLHRTTTKKYHLLRDGITQQRETEEFYHLQLIKGLSTSSIFSLPYRRSTKARANSIAISGPWSRHSNSPPPLIL